MIYVRAVRSLFARNQGAQNIMTPLQESSGPHPIKHHVYIQAVHYLDRQASTNGRTIVIYWVRVVSLDCLRDFQRGILVWWLCAMLVML